jgi:hypothetical protein
LDRVRAALLVPQKKSMQDCRSAGVACQVVCIGAGEDVRFVEAVEAANSEADSRKLGGYFN